jgi:hypothetical protein
VATIDYDRLTLGGSAEYYVSFDNTVVGELQGQGLADCLGDEAANIVYLNGSPGRQQRDAVRRGRAQRARPDDAVHGGRRAGRPGWDNAEAGTIFEQMFTENNGEIDGVLAANDGLGNAAIAILRKNNLAGEVPVTGQDATVQGLQNVLDGTQCMTVYKSAKLEAGALADLAIGLINGEEARPRAPSSTRPTTARSRRSCWSRSPSPRRTWADVVEDGGVTARICAPATTPTSARTPESPDPDPGGGTPWVPATWARLPPVRHTRESLMSNSTPLLQLRGINKSFGAVHVLHDVDLNVYAGQVTALVGDNGAGKSTLVKAIAGIYSIDSGEYLFEGTPVTVHSPRMRRRWESRSCTRTSPCATTSTSCRTCSSAGRSARGSCSTRPRWRRRRGPLSPPCRCAP